MITVIISWDRSIQPGWQWQWWPANIAILVSSGTAIARWRDLTHWIWHLILCIGTTLWKWEWKWFRKFIEMDCELNYQKTNHRIVGGNPAPARQFVDQFCSLQCVCWWCDAYRCPHFQYYSVDQNYDFAVTYHSWNKWTRWAIDWNVWTVTKVTVNSQYHRIFRYYVLHIFGPWIFEWFPFGLQANSGVVFRSKTINGRGDFVAWLQCCFVRFSQCGNVVVLVILIHAGAQ